jgi:hypothetical protein
VILLIFLSSLVSFGLIKVNIELRLELQCNKEMLLIDRMMFPRQGLPKLILSLSLNLLKPFISRPEAIRPLTKLLILLVIIVTELNIPTLDKKLLTEILKVNLAVEGNAVLIGLESLVEFVVLLGFCLGLFEDFLLEPYPKVFALVHVRDLGL